MKTILVTINNNIVRLVKNLVAKCKSIKFKRNKHRYFYVSYFCRDNNGPGISAFWVVESHGEFINATEIKKSINQKNMIILNIMELSKKDYETYIR
jgi:hypothetical protein